MTGLGCPLWSPQERLHSWPGVLAREASGGMEDFAGGGGLIRQRGAPPLGQIPPLPLSWVGDACR